MTCKWEEIFCFGHTRRIQPQNSLPASFWIGFFGWFRSRYRLFLPSRKICRWPCLTRLWGFTRDGIGQPPSFEGTLWCMKRTRRRKICSNSDSRLRLAWELQISACASVRILNVRISHKFLVRYLKAIDLAVGGRHLLKWQCSYFSTRNSRRNPRFDLLIRIWYQPGRSDTWEVQKILTIDRHHRS